MASRPHSGYRSNRGCVKQKLPPRIDWPLAGEVVASWETRATRESDKGVLSMHQKALRAELGSRDYVRGKRWNAFFESSHGISRAQRPYTLMPCP